MRGEAFDKAAADQLRRDKADPFGMVLRLRAAPPQRIPHAPVDPAGIGIDIGRGVVELRFGEMADLSFFEVQHTQGAALRGAAGGRKGAVEPQIAAITAHTVVDEIEGFLHWRDLLPQNVAGNPRIRDRSRG